MNQHTDAARVMIGEALKTYYPPTSEALLDCTKKLTTLETKAIDALAILLTRIDFDRAKPPRRPTFPKTWAVEDGNPFID